MLPRVVIKENEARSLSKFDETTYAEARYLTLTVPEASRATAGEGAMSADLGTTKRKDGTEQVTYNGHPLYTFVGDKAAGEANGNESEGTWFALDESGSAVKGTASAESEPESSAGGGGGGY